MNKATWTMKTSDFDKLLTRVRTMLSSGMTAEEIRTTIPAAETMNGTLDFAFKAAKILNNN